MTTIKHGVVRFPAGKLFQGEHGSRQNIKVVFDDGSEDSIWFDAGKQPHSSLKKGDRVQVLFEGDRKKLVEQDQAGTAEAPERWSQEHRDLIWVELQQRAKILKTCHVQMTALFTHPDTQELLLEPEMIQKYACTLYLDLKELWDAKFS